eukprot:gnl/TRDRNA2_/TRDRNA2_42184_c0_seq1.p1 gnl/TRDRNA2_/TRDRNA2_42184_c0~~gnl/TRDRNA2_/TRDRNA2_42184_c0_seq1.p1  ORF type:complete len:513 (+),score=83.49 gnl/TRDRNA2_/TRDRNA2_42184_c0_seq1:112-1650(+)
MGQCPGRLAQRAPLAPEEQRAPPLNYGSTTPALRALRGEEEDNRSVELADVVESFGMRRFHVWLLTVHSVASAAASAVVSCAPLAMEAIREAYGVDHAASTLASTAVSAGALIGLPIFGWANDAIGRRACLIIQGVLILVLSLLHLLVPAGTGGTEFVMFVALRIAIGIPFGGLAGLACLHLLEFVPAGRRGLMSMLGTLGWSMGGIVVLFMADKLMLSWRMLLASPAPFCIILIICLIFIHESPRWLFVTGRNESGRVVVDAVLSSAPLNPDDAPPRFRKAPDTIVISLDEDDESGKTSLDERLKALFGLRLLHVMLCCIVAMVAINGATYGIGVWMPEILKGLLLMNRFPYRLLIWGQVADIFGTVCCAFLLDRVGRKIVLVSSATGFAIGLCALPNLGGDFTLIAIAFIWASFVTSFMWGAAKVYCAEALPTDVRGTGNAIASLSGRSAGMILPAMVGMILQGPGIESTDGVIGPVHLALYSMALVALAGAVAGLLIPKETANMKLSDV